MDDNTLSFGCIEDYNRWAHVDTPHPLVNAFYYPQNCPSRGCRMYIPFYGVYLKIGVTGNIYYGNNNYEYEDGTLLFNGPGQIVDNSHRGPYYQNSGRALIFHPDLIAGTSVAAKMRDYTFFTYDVSEALRLTDREREIVNQLMDNIAEELHTPSPYHRDTLIVENIDLLLTYCLRFYDRQFTTRTVQSHSVLAAFENVINDYMTSDKPARQGMLNVQYCADELHLSANYLGDLIKSQTVISPLKHIHAKVVEIAKQMLCDPAVSVNEVAYRLGFEYPQHFTRMFKKYAGCSPAEYQKRYN